MIAGASPPRLGFCFNFRVQQFPASAPGQRSRSLAFLDGCARHLGCTLLLHGAELVELRKVKRILHLVLLGAYNARLETAYIKDSSTELSSKQRSACWTFSTSEGNLDAETVHNAFSDRSEAGDNNLLTAVPVANQWQRLAQAANTQIMQDASDPLNQFALSLDDEIFFDNSTSFKEKATAHTLTFKSRMDGLILNLSPYLRVQLPFVESTEAASCSILRYVLVDPRRKAHGTESTHHRMRMEDFNSLSKKPCDQEVDNLASQLTLPQPTLQPTHKFMMCTHAPPLGDSYMDELAADFRARGSQLGFGDDAGPPSLMFKLPPPFVPPLSKAEMEKQEVAAEKAKRSATDIFDPRPHQRLAVLYMSFSQASVNAPTHCIQPWILKMEFYGSNDVTLGQFLERCCFREGYLCRSGNCMVSMAEHVRRFVHYNGCVQLVLRHFPPELKKLDDIVATNAFASSGICMWSFCRRCRRVSRINAMSDRTWHLSFAKFLDLFFHGEGFNRICHDDSLCEHSSFQYHYHFFGFRTLVASFKFSPILLHEVVLPPLQVRRDRTEGVLPTECYQNIKHLINVSHQKYSDILEKVKRLVGLFVLISLS